MHITAILSIAAGCILGQVHSQTLREAIASRDELSTLLSLLDDNEELAAQIAALPDLTIFAPSDTAESFSVERYTEGWAQNLESELRYHILDGWLLTSEDITEDERFYPTLAFPRSADGDLNPSLEAGVNRTLGEGAFVRVVEEDGNVRVGRDSGSSTTVTTADIEYNNGVIHIIDALLFTPMLATTTLVSNVASEPFSRAITNVTGLAESLSSASRRPFTIFAPNEAAFEAVGDAFETVSDDQFARIVEYHIVGGPQPFFDYDLEDGMQLQTLSVAGGGGNLTVTVAEGGDVFINQARVVNTNILHENGVIHILDAILDPDNAGPPEDSSSEEPFVADFESDAPEDYTPPAEATGVIEAGETVSVTDGAATATPTSTSVPAWTATGTAAGVSPTGGADAEGSSGDDGQDEDEDEGSDAASAASSLGVASWGVVLLGTVCAGIGFIA